MKAKDLKIGNLVRNNMNGEILIPCDILCDGINTENYHGLNYGFIEPIPLTEKWLLKFNEMKKFDCLVYLPIMNLKAEIHFLFYRNEIVSIIKSDFADLILDRIKYVHQLQNLYFALTNEELTIKSE